VRAVIDHASGTAGSYPPAMGEGIAEGLDFHENKIRTFVRAVDDTLAGRWAYVKNVRNRPEHARVPMSTVST
jgi:hypothetical protein